jgi:hypothetical protein
MTESTIGAERKATNRPARIDVAEEQPNNRRTSALLRDYVAGLTGERVSLGSLRDALGDRGFGLLLFVFSVPNLVPVNIPLLSAVLGVPLVLLAAQLSYGRHKPWFPDWLTRQSVPRSSFESVMLKSIPYLERAELFLRPRLVQLLSWTGERLVGLFLLVLAVVLTLPIPFGNWLPAFAISIIGLAIVEKDGVAVLIGIVTGVIGLAIAGTVLVGLIYGLILLFSGLFA